MNFLYAPVFAASSSNELDQVKEALVEEEPTPEPIEVLTPPVSKDSSDKAYEAAESLLDEAFAFCKDQDIHDRIINHLNDAKYDETKETNEILTKFATQHPENMLTFQSVASQNNKKWQSEMQKDAYGQLYTWMGTLNSYFTEREAE